MPLNNFLILRTNFATTKSGSKKANNKISSENFSNHIIHLFGFIMNTMNRIVRRVHQPRSGRITTDDPLNKHTHTQLITNSFNCKRRGLKRETAGKVTRGLVNRPTANRKIRYSERNC